jgi:hypothetical protein
MRKMFGSLIILAPASPRIHRLRYTRKGISGIVVIALLALCGVLTARYMMPIPVPDPERARLERENQALKAEKRELEMQTKRLEFRVLKLEEMSQQMSDSVRGN